MAVYKSGFEERVIECFNEYLSRFGLKREGSRILPKNSFFGIGISVAEFCGMPSAEKRKYLLRIYDKNYEGTFRLITGEIDRRFHRTADFDIGESVQNKALHALQNVGSHFSNLTKKFCTI